MANQFNILDYTYGPLLKTGQVINRTPAGRTTKDDGGFQRGIEGSKADEQYHILTTGQYAGTTNVTVNGFTDAHTNQCVFDKVTGLMWNREETPQIYGTGNQDLLWDDTAGANEDFFNYCDVANTSLLSNFSDWRIPNISELYSLAISTSTIPTPKINSVAFPLWRNGFSFSSTTNPALATFALVVNFNDALIDPLSKITRSPCPLVRLGI